MSLSVVEIIVAFIAVTTGAAVQGSIGFAFVLVAAPVVGIMEPRALPATFVLLVLPIGIWMGLRERGHIDRRGFIEMTAGRLVGTAAAVWLLVAVPDDKLAIVVGGAILSAVLLSVAAPGFEAGAGSRVAAGAISGLMGTVGAVGGPAMALAYQRRSAAELRATLAVAAIAGSFLSLGGLSVAGRLDRSHIALAVLLFPAEVAGLAASTQLIKVIDRKRMRTAVLVFAALGGAAVVVRGVF